jgi:hypothetical protein
MRKALEGSVLRDAMIAVFIGIAGAVGLIAMIYSLNHG